MMIKYIKDTLKKIVPVDYLKRAIATELLFHYYPVYNPRSNTIDRFMPHNDCNHCNILVCSNDSLASSSSSVSKVWSGPCFTSDQMLNLCSFGMIIPSVPIDTDIIIEIEPLLVQISNVIDLSCDDEISTNKSFLSNNNNHQQVVSIDIEQENMKPITSSTNCRIKRTTNDINSSVPVKKIKTVVEYQKFRTLTDLYSNY